MRNPWKPRAASRSAAASSKSSVMSLTTSALHSYGSCKDVQLGSVPFTVGFDLDMTLIDPRPGMAAVLNEVGARSGHALDGEHFAANLGPPLDMTYRDMGVPEEEIDRKSVVEGKSVDHG